MVNKISGGQLFMPDNANAAENRKQFSIYLPIEVYEKLVELAEEDDRSLVSYVRGVLKKHVQKACAE